jgi:hypothetical protein
MDISLYRYIHLIGLSLVVMSLGGVLLHTINGGTKESNGFRKGVMMTHGIGLLLLLVAGFGMLAKLGIHGVPVWVGIKLVVWAILGALVVVAYRKPHLSKKLWFAVPALVFLSVFVARTHG